ncbi:MAG: MarR family transcriptional regulator [Lachnospiraceae bacterium]|nr:MarR family transcriptional regulator [Lachnospiraceae bacterium]
MPPEARHIALELKTLDALIKKRIDSYIRAVSGDDSLTRMHQWIIGYLYRNSDRPIYQRDVEAEFKISRSTTSSMLTLMEKKGLLIRESVEQDARLKKISLTPAAIERHMRLMSMFSELDGFLEGILDAEEKKEFYHYVDKLRTSIVDDMEKNHIPIDC